MKRIVHCERHRTYHRPNQNFPKKEKIPNQIRTTKITETIYRSPNRIKVNVDIKKNKKHLLRLSLPGYIYRT